MIETSIESARAAAPGERPHAIAPEHVAKVVRGVVAYLDASGVSVIKGQCVLANIHAHGVNIGMGPVGVIASQTIAGPELIQHAAKGHHPLVVDDSQGNGTHYAYCIECDALHVTSEKG